MLSFEQYKNEQLIKMKENMFSPNDTQDPSTAATTWFSNSRFAPSLRQKLSTKAAKKKMRGKML